MRELDVKSGMARRILSIDALRGFDMMWIMGFGQTLRKVGEVVGTDWGAALAYQMKHVYWAGLHLHDLIFPTFIFLAGASWPFSLEKHCAKGMTDGQIFFRHVLKRFVLLFCLGLITSGLLGFNFIKLRYMSVLGRIACAWFVAATTLLFLKPRKTAVAFVLMLAGYMLALRFLPGLIDPGCTKPWSSDTGNLVFMFDRMVTGVHFEKFGGEGILSAFFGTSGCAYLGIFSGLMLKREDWTAMRKSVTLAAFSSALSAAGVAASTVCPCVKNMWSPTFVLMSGAIASALLALFHWLIDVKGWTGWSFFFRVIGMNAITIYVLRCFVDFSVTSRRFLWGTLKLLPQEWSEPVVLAGSFIVCWVLLLFLYRKKIFLKV